MWKQKKTKLVCPQHVIRGFVPQVKQVNCSSGCAFLNGSVGFSFPLPHNTACCSRLQRWSPLHVTSNGLMPPSTVAAVSDQKLILCEFLLKDLLPQMLCPGDFLFQQDNLLQYIRTMLGVRMVIDMSLVKTGAAS